MKSLVTRVELGELPPYNLYENKCPLAFEDVVPPAKKMPKEVFEDLILTLVERIPEKGNSARVDVLAILREPAKAIKMSDALTCKRGEWLNDVVIDYFAELFALTNAQKATDDNKFVYVLKTFFWTVLLGVKMVQQKNKEGEVIDGPGY